jgi:hypothetical protein
LKRRIGNKEFPGKYPEGKKRSHRGHPLGINSGRRKKPGIFIFFVAPAYPACRQAGGRQVCGEWIWGSLIVVGKNPPA